MENSSKSLLAGLFARTSSFPSPTRGGQLQQTLAALGKSLGNRGPNLGVVEKKRVALPALPVCSNRTINGMELTNIGESFCTTSIAQFRCPAAPPLSPAGNTLGVSDSFICYALGPGLRVIYRPKGNRALIKTESETAVIADVETRGEFIAICTTESADLYTVQPVDGKMSLKKELNFKLGEGQKLLKLMLHPISAKHMALVSSIGLHFVHPQATSSGLSQTWEETSIADAAFSPSGEKLFALTYSEEKGMVLSAFSTDTDSESVGGPLECEASSSLPFPVELQAVRPSSMCFLNQASSDALELLVVHENGSLTMWRVVLGQEATLVQNFCFSLLDSVTCSNRLAHIPGKSAFMFPATINKVCGLVIGLLSPAGVAALRFVKLQHSVVSSVIVEENVVNAYLLCSSDEGTSGVVDCCKLEEACFILPEDLPTAPSSSPRMLSAPLTPKELMGGTPVTVIPPSKPTLLTPESLFNSFAASSRAATQSTTTTDPVQKLLQMNAIIKTRTPKPPSPEPVKEVPAVVETPPAVETKPPSPEPVKEVPAVVETPPAVETKPPSPEPVKAVPAALETPPVEEEEEEEEEEFVEVEETEKEAPPATVPIVKEIPVEETPTETVEKAEPLSAIRSDVSDNLILSEVMDLKKLAASNALHLEQANVKQHQSSVDRLGGRFEKALKKRDKAEMERIKKILANVSTQLQQFVPNVVQSVVQSVMEKEIPGMVTTAVQQALGGSQISAVVEASVAKHLPGIVAESIKTSVEPHVQSALTRALKSQVVPGFERVMRKSAEQMNASITNSLADLTGKIEASATAVNSTTSQCVSSVKDVGRIVGPRLTNLVKDGSTWLEAAKMTLASIQQQTAALEQQRTAFAEMISSHESAMVTIIRSAGQLAVGGQQGATEAPLSTEILMDLLSSQEYEEAFRKVLNLNDSSLLMWLCEQVKPKLLFRQKPCPLSQMSILCLLDQICGSPSEDLALKVRWLNQISTKLDPHDSHVSEHIGSVLSKCASVLLEWYKTNSDEDLSDKLKMLIHVVNSLEMDLKGR